MSRVTATPCFPAPSPPPPNWSPLLSSAIKFRFNCSLFVAFPIFISAMVVACNSCLSCLSIYPSDDPSQKAIRSPRSTSLDDIIEIRNLFVVLHNMHEEYSVSSKRIESHTRRDYHHSLISLEAKQKMTHHENEV